MDAVLANIMAFTADSNTGINNNNEVGVSQRNTTLYKTTPQLKAANISLGVICFSKDRPFQLHQFLCSLEYYCQPYPDIVMVLYHPGTYDSLYQRVFAMHLKVQPVKESNFQSDLLDCTAKARNVASHLMLAVDDLIFVNQIKAKQYATCLGPDSSIFSMQLKLHSGVVYSHSGSKVSPPPRLTGARTSSDVDGSAGLTYFTYSLSAADGGGSEWRYPFDLCASIYRTVDVQSILASIIDSKAGISSSNSSNSTSSSSSSSSNSSGNSSSSSSSNSSSNSSSDNNITTIISNPNRLEFLGNQAYWSGELSRRYRICACTAAYVACVVTVNRVQSTYNVPIYRNLTGDLATLNALLDCSVSPTAVTDGGGGGNKSTSNTETDQLMSLQATSLGFDFARYRCSNNLSVHIGEVYFAAVAAYGETQSELETSGVPRNPSTVQVSVLLPVHNAEHYLRECLDSLLTLPQGCRFEVVLVDDGSSDGSAAIASEYVDIAEQAGVSMVVLSLPHEGLVAALNAGLARARCNAVARMDSDDICEPYRLARQLEFLSLNPSIHVLGAQALVFSDDPCSPSSSVAANLPTHPVLMQWEMLFRCAVVHPSVMFRRDVVLQCGGYSTYACGVRGEDRGHTPSGLALPSTGVDMDCIEDYSLWARVLDRHPLSIASLPDVLLHLRVHSGSKSKVETAGAQAASRALQCAMITRQVGAAVDTVACNALLDPARCLNSASDAFSATELLAVVYNAFCAEYMGNAPIGVDNTSSEPVLYLQNMVTGQPSSVTSVNRSDEDRSDQAVAAVLEYSRQRLARRVLAVASKKFPNDGDVKSLLAGYEANYNRGIADSSEQCVSFIKEMLVMNKL